MLLGNLMLPQEKEHCCY